MHHHQSDEEDLWLEVDRDGTRRWVSRPRPALTSVPLDEEFDAVSYRSDLSTVAPRRAIDRNRAKLAEMAQRMNEERVSVDYDARRGTDDGQRTEEYWHLRKDSAMNPPSEKPESIMDVQSLVDTQGSVLEPRRALGKGRPNINREASVAESVATGTAQSPLKPLKTPPVSPPKASTPRPHHARSPSNTSNLPARSNTMKSHATAGATTLVADVPVLPPTIRSTSTSSLETLLESTQPSIIHISPVLLELGIRTPQHLRAIVAMNEVTRDREVRDEALKRGVTVVEWAMLLDLGKTLAVQSGTPKPKSP